MLAASHSWHRLQPRQSLTFAASAVRSRSRITFLNCFKEGKFLSLCAYIMTGFFLGFEKSLTILELQPSLNA